MLRPGPCDRSLPAPCSATPRCDQGVSPPQRGQGHAPGSVACPLLSGEAGGVVEGAPGAGAGGALGGPLVWRLRVRRGHARTANAVRALTVGTSAEIALHTAHTCIHAHPVPGAADARTSTSSRCHTLSITSLRERTHHMRKPALRVTHLHWSLSSTL